MPDRPCSPGILLNSPYLSNWSESGLSTLYVWFTQRWADKSRQPRHVFFFCCNTVQQNLLHAAAIYLNHLECILLVDAALGSCWTHGLRGEVKVVLEYLRHLLPLCSARYTTGRCAQCLPAAPPLVSQAPASPCNRPVRMRQCGAMGTMEGMMALWLCKVHFACPSPP